MGLYSVSFCPIVMAQGDEDFLFFSHLSLNGVCFVCNFEGYTSLGEELYGYDYWETLIAFMEKSCVFVVKCSNKSGVWFNNYSSTTVHRHGGNDII